MTAKYEDLSQSASSFEFDAHVITQCFLIVLQVRAAVVVAFLLITRAGLYSATRLPNDSGIDRLIVSGDPVAQTTF